MSQPATVVLSEGQRLALIFVALFGFLVLNGVFLYFCFLRPGDFSAAIRHPVTAALMLEAFLIVALGAVLLAKRPIGPWGWKSFVVFSLLGGLGFSVPLVLLLNAKKADA
jgi:hypothetical protein